MNRDYRCVVTGCGPEGKSIVVRDERVSTATLGCADFWKTTSSPASLLEDWNQVAAGQGEKIPVQLLPPAGGTIFRFFEIPPQDKSLDAAQTDRVAAAAFAEAGAGHCRVDTQRNPMMHTTPTIDYVVLLRGEVTLLLDKGEVALRPFDVVVQRGTNHYWINMGTEPALLMGVLLDADAK